jgi:uncharacterized protein (TIGR03000 family)
MYTIVVMAALGTSADVPDCGRHRRQGCCGGDCYGCRGGCYGCCGGCWGGSCNGCWGGSRGGAYSRAGYASPYGYANSSYMPYPNSQPYVSTYYDPATGGVRTRSNVNDGNAHPAAQQEERTGTGIRSDDSSVRPRDQAQPGGNKPSPQSQSSASVPATIVVSLPADARLTVDGQLTRSNTATRTFVSPPLPQGKTYIYNLKAELNGQAGPVTTSQDVEVRAGEVSRVTLAVPRTRSAE